VTNHLHLRYGFSAVLIFFLSISFFLNEKKKKKKKEELKQCLLKDQQNICISKLGLLVMFLIQRHGLEH